MNLPAIVFIGSGNLAWHLAPALDNTDYVVTGIYSSTPHHAETLCQRLYQAQVYSSLDFSDSGAHIFIIAVSDDVISSIVRHLVIPKGAILLHTSGSHSVAVLNQSTTPHVGVWYPLQTFSKERDISFNNIPILFEGATREVEKIIVNMAKALGAHPQKTTSLERQAIHLAAVFASNFVNHMLFISDKVLQRHHFNLEILKPLIKETIAKGLELGPHKSQTGPAMRNDMNIMKNHLNLLESTPLITSIYSHISQHIMAQYTH